MEAQWRRPYQPHLGTRIRCDRCSLPGLAGLTPVRREGTDMVAIDLAYKCILNALVAGKQASDACVVEFFGRRVPLRSRARQVLWLAGLSAPTGTVGGAMVGGYFDTIMQQSAKRRDRRATSGYTHAEQAAG